MSKLVRFSHLAELAYCVLKNFLARVLIGVYLVSYVSNLVPFRE